MKILDTLTKVNTFILILSAIFIAIGSIVGSILFVYTSVVGMINGILKKNFNEIVVNATFLSLNLYFIIVAIMKVF